MRRLSPLAIALVLGWSVTASAEGPYGEDDGTYEEEVPFFRDATPEPPPPPVRRPEPSSPYTLLPSETPSQPYQAAPQQAPDHQHWQYNGPHAINAQYGSGWCNVQGAHYHPYPPFDDRLFQENRGGYDFLGDPADFGYTGGNLNWYSAAHPIATGWGIGWCYIPYPHRHLYAPMGAYYSMCGPYWCWGGPFDAWYWYYRPYYFGFYSAWYPRYYRGGIYHRTGVAASPGRFGTTRPGYNRAPGTAGHPGGRPGGYARPVPQPAYRRPTTLYHRLPADSLRPRYQGRPAPGMTHQPMPSRQYAPSRPTPAPRYGTPSHSAPRSFGAPRSYSAPRYPAARTYRGWSSCPP
jgi:hypothetical protein